VNKMIKYNYYESIKKIVYLNLNVHYQKILEA